MISKFELQNNKQCAAIKKITIFIRIIKLALTRNECSRNEQRLNIQGAFGKFVA